MYAHCIHRDDLFCAVVGMSLCIFEQLLVFMGVDWIQLAEDVISVGVCKYGNQLVIVLTSETLLASQKMRYTDLLKNGTVGQKITRCLRLLLHVVDSDPALGSGCTQKWTVLSKFRMFLKGSGALVG